MLSENFNGIQYRLADNWFEHIDINKYKNSPIHYLEIDTLCVANLLSVSRTYGLHPDSKLHCIDPWELIEFSNQVDTTKIFKKRDI